MDAKRLMSKREEIQKRHRDLVRIVQLSHKTLTTQQIADKLHVSRETIRNDIRSLKEKYPQLTSKPGYYKGGIVWDKTKKKETSS